MKGILQNGKLSSACARPRSCANSIPQQDLSSRHFTNRYLDQRPDVWLGRLQSHALWCAFQQPKAETFCIHGQVGWAESHSAHKLRGFCGLSMSLECRQHYMHYHTCLLGLHQHKHRGCCLVFVVETWSCAGFTRFKHCHIQCSTGAGSLPQMSRW